MSNDSSENNPYARKSNPAPGTAGHEVTLEELHAANKAGNPNPATVNTQNLGRGDIMSGKVDRAGNPMTVGAAEATEANDKILSKHEQLAKTGHTTADGKFIPTPPNTPSV